VGVPFVAADLVYSPLGETDDVERVKADIGVRDRGVDRLLVAAGHVDRDRGDRVLAVAEEVEEPSQGLGVATRRAPHDRAGLMVDNGGEVPLPAAVADLINGGFILHLRQRVVGRDIGFGVSSRGVDGRRL
jgi:hypothetical protein